jgi:hypothetical protein
MADTLTFPRTPFLFWRASAFFFSSLKEAVRFLKFCARRWPELSPLCPSAVT